MTQNGGTYCDGLTWQKYGGLQQGLHLNRDCAGGTSVIVGTANKKGWFFTDNYNSSLYSGLGFEVYKPYQTGSKWALWICLSGSTCFLANAGTYKVGFPARRTGGASMTKKVREIIAARKAARTALP
jgi:hypothetical protein